MIAPRVLTEKEIHDALRARGFSPTETRTATGRFWIHGESGEPIQVPDSLEGYYADWMLYDLMSRVGEIVPSTQGQQPTAGPQDRLLHYMSREEPSSMALETEIATYETRREELEKYYSGKFVVIRDGDVVGAFDTFANAAADAVARFGRGPYLIRQVGAPPPSVPVSWLYQTAA